MTPGCHKARDRAQLRKPYDFHPVLPKRSTEVEWLQTGIQSPVNAVRRIINQCHRRKRIRSSCRRRRRCVDFAVASKAVYEYVIAYTSYNFESTEKMQVQKKFETDIRYRIGGCKKLYNARRS